MHGPKGPKADQPPHGQDDDEQGKIRYVHAPSFLLPRRRFGNQPLQDDEIEDRPDAKQDQRMTIHAIQELLPRRELLVFTNRQHVDVAAASSVKIAARRVMNGVMLSPTVIGRHRDDTQQAATQVVCPP